jgi:hypothetical protein
MKLKMAVFWLVAPCNLVESERYFRAVVFISLMMEAAIITETSVKFYQNTPEDSHLDIRPRENLKSRQV